MDRIHIYLCAGVAGLAALWVALFLTFRRREGPIEDHGMGWAVHGLWACALLKITIIYVTVANGYVTTWADDAIRFLMSIAMKNRLDLGFEDHIWPGGPFIFHGLMMRFHFNDMIAVRLMAAAFSAGSVLATGLAAWELSRNRVAAVTAAFLLAILPWHSLLSTGAMSEVPMVFFMMASVALGARAWRWREQGRRGGAAGLLLAGLLATLAASCRYEGWMFVASSSGLLGLLWLSRSPLAARLGREPQRGAREVMLLAGTVLLALAFPIAWMISSRSELGSFTAFFSNQVSMNTENLEGSLLDRLSFFPEGMQYQIGALWGWLIAGLLIALVDIRRNKHGAAVGAFLVGYCALFTAVVAAKGAGVSQERYSLSIVVALLPFFGLTVGKLAEGARHLGRWWNIVPLLALACVMYSIYSFGREASHHHRHYPKWGYHNETFVAGYLLSHEFHTAQMLPGMAKEGRVVVWRPELPDDDHISHIPLMTGWSWRILQLHEREFPENLVEDNLTIVLFGEPVALPPDRYVEVVTMPWMRIYHDGDALRAAGR